MTFLEKLTAPAAYTAQFKYFQSTQSQINGYVLMHLTHRKAAGKCQHLIKASNNSPDAGVSRANQTDQVPQWLYALLAFH